MEETINYEYEYGRYKKKVADQQKEIAELHGYIDGMKQVMDANNAIMVAMLVDTSSIKHDPFIVRRATINEALKGGYQIVSEYDQNNEEYEMWYSVPENKETEEAGE